jgi:hypothetical protein
MAITKILCKMPKLYRLKGMTWPYVSRVSPSPNPNVKEQAKVANLLKSQVCHLRFRIRVEIIKDIRGQT